MARLELREYVEAIADATGTARVAKGPARYGDSWKVTLLSTSTTSVAETQLRVYRGPESPSAQVASTYSGNADTAGGEAIPVGAQDKLTFVWSGADVGARCTCRIEGDLNTERY